MGSKAERKQARRELVQKELDKRAIAEHGAVVSEATVIPLGKLAIFFIIGCAILFLNHAYILHYFPSIPKGWISGLEGLVNFAAGGIAAFPIWWSMICGGWMGLLKIPSYVVVTTTTYADGTTSKSSDFGEESQFTAGMMVVFWFVVGYFIAMLLTCVVFAVQAVMLIIKFPSVKNKLSYAIQLAVVAAFFALAPSYVAKLQPIFDAEHFKPAEIERIAESARKNLYSGNFSLDVSKWGKKIKDPYTAIVSYNKAKDETVVEVLAGKQNFASWHSEKEIKYLKKEAAKKFIKEFDKGNAKVLPGKYTFKNNELVKSEVDAEIFGNRALGEAGIAEITGLLPSNLIFKRILSDKDKLRLISAEEHLDEKEKKGANYEKYCKNIYRIATANPAYSGNARRKDFFSVNFLKIGGDDYKLSRESFLFVTPYSVDNEK